MIVKKNKFNEKVWGNECKAWTLEETESFSVLQEEMPSGTEDVFHYHQKADQFMFVLSGELTISLQSGENVVLQKEQGYTIKSLSVHKVSNASDQVCHFLVFSNPSHRAGGGDRVEIVEKD